MTGNTMSVRTPLRRPKRRIGVPAHTCNLFFVTNLYKFVQLIFNIHFSIYLKNVQQETLRCFTTQHTAVLGDQFLLCHRSGQKPQLIMATTHVVVH